MKNYTISNTSSSSKMAVVIVLGFIIVMSGISAVMFYLGRQSVFDHYTVTPHVPRLK